MSTHPAVHVPADTPLDSLDTLVEAVRSRKDAFLALSLPERIDMLDRFARDTMACAQEQVRTACIAKGIPAGSATTAEEWLGGPFTVLRNIRLLRQTLIQIRDHGKPQLPKDALRVRSGGQVTLRVFPAALEDKLLNAGFTADIWMDPELRPSDIDAHMAREYQAAHRATEGRVALVLGAGNVASIGPMDVLYKMFVENQVCILKMNPVNAYLGPYIERGFRAAVDAGFLRVVYGGAEQGEALCQHEGIDEIHITGSDFVHDIIVWGPPGEEQDRRKAEGEPVLDKRITSELGCVTPVIITPGEWTEKELDFQVQNVATMLSNNASFNCNAAKLIVTSKNWPQRETFLARLRTLLATLPPRQAYYPGAEERFERFADHYDSTIRLGKATDGYLPWALASGLDPSDTDNLAFSNEAWCAFLAETPIDAKDASEFLDKATTFVNEHVWGTLSCSLIVDPRTAADSQHASALDDAIARLRYGSVVINHWPGIAYGLVVAPWGAHPGHTLEDIGSGIGVVHNTYMLEGIQKTVIEGPFLVNPKPPWFCTHRNAHNVAKRLARYEFQPSYLKIPAIALNALRG